MSFREKSAWASLAVMLVVYVPYFVHVFRLFGRGELKGGAVLGQFISAVLFQIFLLIVVHIAIAIQSRQQQTDERDRAIEATSYKIAYLALISFLLCGDSKRDCIGLCSEPCAGFQVCWTAVPKSVVAALLCHGRGGEICGADC